MTGLKACKNSWNKRALSTDFQALCLLHLGQRILSFLKWKMNGLFPNSSHPFCFQLSFALILLHFNGKTFFHPFSPCQKFLNLQPSSLSYVSYLSLLLKYCFFFIFLFFSVTQVLQMLFQPSLLSHHHFPKLSINFPSLWYLSPELWKDKL